MKVSYSSLHCPHCGAKSFNLINDDVFLCDYCGQKFNFKLEDIDFNDENKIFIEEIKEEFNKKIADLNQEKKVEHFCLLQYNRLANPKLLPTVALACLIISIIVFFVELFSFDLSGILIGGIAIAISIPLYILSKLYMKRKYIRYKPFISICASNIIECEQKINAYISLISKLTK